MYSFDVNKSRRNNARKIRILIVIIIVLSILLAGVSITWFRSRNVTVITRDALVARAITEVSDAQSACYRLTQSSGTSSMNLLADVRAHIYCLDSLNALAGNIFGAGTVIVDPDLLDQCIETLDQSGIRLQAGNVMTTLYTTLRDEVNAIADTFNQ